MGIPLGLVLATQPLGLVGLSAIMVIEIGSVIQNGKVVSLNYVLTNGQGQELDRSQSGQPFVYLHGASQIVPGLEAGLQGLRTGEKKKVVVAPAEGYGEIDPNLRAQVARSNFPPDVTVTAGMMFQANLGGVPTDLRIHAVEGDTVTVDANHPLAGETLHFDIEVVSIRAATSEEMTHGHAHGADGHHHH